MILLVNDANILIDLLKIDLLKQFFQLQYEFHITDIVAAEIQEENVFELEPYFADGSLHKKSFSFEELGGIQVLKERCRVLSIPDCSCIFHAKTLSATLLTGDAALRRTAEQSEIPVHGILWVFDELVDKEIISKKQASGKLTSLLEMNGRLPVAECKKRIRRWKRG